MRTLVITFFLLVATTIAAQEFYTGLIEKEGEYEKIPQKATLLTRDYKNMPSRYSLEAYCPTPLSQGQYGTCTSWAAAYAARTITEAVNNHWTDSAIINREAFSPPFLYKHIKNYNDYNCQNGSAIPDALSQMKAKGVPKLKNFNIWCADKIPAEIYRQATNYRIDDYFTLFWEEDSYSKKINATKKAISQNRPVIIGMDVYDSFSSWSIKNVWNGEMNGKLGGHAMCVVGYDDNKYGGAFLLMNSWGNRWGNNGFIWVTYRDYWKHTHYGGEIYVKAKPQPKPKPKPTPEPKPQPKPKPTLSGSMYLQLSTGEKMGFKYNAMNYPHYETQDEYISGTRYRVYVSNNAPAYVYIIGSDLHNNVSKVFPPAENISPALVYSTNNIAIPDEKWFIEMDNTSGKDYLCILYSPKALPINEIIEKIKTNEGSFYDKMKASLNSTLLNKEEVEFEQSSITFKANTDEQVVPLIVEVKHK